MAARPDDSACTARIAIRCQMIMFVSESLASSGQSAGATRKGTRRRRSSSHSTGRPSHIDRARKASGGKPVTPIFITCLLYTSDAADEEDSVDLGGRRIIK